MLIEIPSREQIDKRLQELEGERLALMALRRAAVAMERVAMRGKPRGAAVVREATAT